MFKPVPDKAALEKLAGRHQITLWGSRFEFLRCTAGIRPASLIGLLGTTGTGKSSVAKAIVADCAMEAPLFLWLNEETPEEYAVGLQRAKANLNRENIIMFHEDQLSASVKKDLDQILFCVFESIIQAGVKLVILDNITSSCLYDSHFGEAGQAKVIDEFRRFTRKNGITIFFLIHTDKNTNNNSGKLISGENVRGTNRSFMAADYFYILQRFDVNNAFFTFITIAKHRNHPELRTKYFRLNYTAGHYSSDEAIDFERVNNAFNDRNYLGKRGKK